MVFDMSPINGSGERGEPGEAESLSKDRLKALPGAFFTPATSWSLFFKLLDARLVVPNGLDLDPKHDAGEDGEEKSFED